MKSLLHLQIVADAQNVVNGSTFFINEGFFNGGHIVAVQAIPRRAKSSTTKCALEVEVLTDRLQEGTHPSIIEGAKEACVEALNDPNIAIKKAAQRGLEILDLPPLKTGDLKGIHFSLWTASHPSEQLGSADTDKRGRVVFRNVPLEVKAFLLCSDGMETEYREHPVKGLHPPIVDDGDSITADPEDPVHSDGADGVFLRAVEAAPEKTPFRRRETPRKRVFRADP